jgi:rhodanese-related sulfurtransferase
MRLDPGCRASARGIAGVAVMVVEPGPETGRRIGEFQKLPRQQVRYNESRDAGVTVQGEGETGSRFPAFAGMTRKIRTSLIRRRPVMSPDEAGRLALLNGHTLLRLTAGVFLLAIGALAVQADDFMSAAMPAAEVRARLGTPQAPLIVDLRTPPEFAIAHLPGAVNIPLPELEKRLDEARPVKGRDLLIYCLNGTRTRQAEPLLYAHDINNFYHLEGSLEGWLQKNYPFEKGGVKRKAW